MKNIANSELLDLSEELRDMAFKLRQKALFLELEHYIKTKESYLKLARVYERSIGKTQSLIELALKYDAPIFVRNKNCKDLLDKRCKMLYNKDITVIAANWTSDANIRGRKYDLILCDEGIEKEALDTLYMCCDTLVGFYN